MSKVTKEEEQKVNNTAPESAAAEQSGATEPVQLTINDLQVLSQIVELASRRGAFQAAELTHVGNAYNKLARFLAFIAESQAKDESTPAA